MQLAAEQEWASRCRERGTPGVVVVVVTVFPLPPHLTDILGIPIPRGGCWPPFPSQVPPLSTQLSPAQLFGVMGMLFVTAYLLSPGAPARLEGMFSCRRQCVS